MDLSAVDFSSRVWPRPIWKTGRGARQWSLRHATDRKCCSKMCNCHSFKTISVKPVWPHWLWNWNECTCDPDSTKIKSSSGNLLGFLLHLRHRRPSKLSEASDAVVAIAHCTMEFPSISESGTYSNLEHIKNGICSWVVSVVFFSIFFFSCESHTFAAPGSGWSKRGEFAVTRLKAKAHAGSGLLI